MLSFYDFPSWVFLFFLIALAVTIFFYSRKFLRIFDAYEMDTSRQLSKPRKKLHNQGKGAEKGKIGKVASRLPFQPRKVDKKLPDFYKSRPPKDGSNTKNLPRSRDSIASISSLGSIIKFSDYQDSDLSSITTADPIGDSELYLSTLPHFSRVHADIPFHEPNPPKRKASGPDDNTSKSNEGMMSIPAQLLGSPAHMRIEQVRITNHPTKLLQYPSTRAQLDRVPEVMIKTCTSVEEVVGKNGSYVKRMRFTENLEPKELRDIP
ncbi:uncharacterized protein LOC141854334 [Brevipalpus obovatus]|uniref:uncharacterized protein LOC141854334 n=1 Tax=Brevipalpus obovatus TaxID=246614 RepID=UPI003D9E0C05